MLRKAKWILIFHIGAFYQCDMMAESWNCEVGSNILYQATEIESASYC
jgi:hypothetical protein